MRRALVLGSILVLGGLAGAAHAAGTATAARTKLRVVVTAQSLHPVLHHTWWYRVRVTAHGKPVACRIHVQVFFNGFPVGEVGRHTLKHGVWKETIVAKGKNAFPRAAVGQHVVWHVIATAKGYTTGVGGLPISVVT